ncbi:hypothetical protein CVT25_003917 [Psilocybe cyanescens]|uniref:Uncharacterized protein n=1 Tax=Psilocybe cyanescens TaxID=93625 RepID=A0A409W4C1_PSICY|nr:hypothetical protein CVT25_003917 [Psilocybe cyanescens]
MTERTRTRQDTRKRNKEERRKKKEKKKTHSSNVGENRVYSIAVKRDEDKFKSPSNIQKTLKMTCVQAQDLSCSSTPSSPAQSSSTTCPPSISSSLSPVATPPCLALLPYPCPPSSHSSPPASPLPHPHPHPTPSSATPRLLLHQHNLADSRVHMARFHVDSKPALPPVALDTNTCTTRP